MASYAICRMNFCSGSASLETAVRQSLHTTAGILLCAYSDHFLLRPLTLNLLTTSIVAPPSNASKWQIGFNSAFKGLKHIFLLTALSLDAYKAWATDSIVK